MNILSRLLILPLFYNEKILFVEECNGCKEKYNKRVELYFGETLICVNCDYKTVTHSRLSGSISFHLMSYGRDPINIIGDEYYYPDIHLQDYE